MKYYIIISYSYQEDCSQEMSLSSHIFLKDLISIQYY